MSVKKPTAEFLANQPYLYRAFEDGQAAVEVYDLMLDEWPADAHLVVDGKVKTDPDAWWFERRFDQEDSETHERFSVLQFHDSFGVKRPSDYIGTHEICLVVHGQIARKLFLTILPWVDPIVEVIGEEEVNGDLIRRTFRLTWPDTTPRVATIIPMDGNNSPYTGYINDDFRVSHDVKTRTTIASGLTYRFFDYSVLTLMVGAESISGVKDTGFLYNGSIDSRPIGLWFDRGDYGELAPSSRIGFSMGAGWCISGNKAYTVGGSRSGLWPYFGVTKFNAGIQPHVGSGMSRIEKCQAQIGRFSNRIEGGHVSFDLNGNLWESDLATSQKSVFMCGDDKEPRFHPSVGIIDGVVSWNGGNIAIPHVRAGYKDHLNRNAMGYLQPTGPGVRVDDVATLVFENLGDFPGYYMQDDSDRFKYVSEYHDVVNEVLNPDGTLNRYIYSNGMEKSDTRVRGAAFTPVGGGTTFPGFAGPWIYNVNAYISGHQLDGQDVILQGGF